MAEDPKVNVRNMSTRHKLIMSAVFLASLFIELCIYKAYMLIKAPVKTTQSFNPITILVTALINTPVAFAFMLLLSAVIAFALVKTLQGKELVFDKRGWKLAEQKTQGENHLMSDMEKRTAFDMKDIFEPTGVILARDKESGDAVTLPFSGPKAPPTGNILVVGGSGFRKTSGVLLGNIYSCIQAGYSLLLMDPKGEIYMETIAAAASRGYKTYIFDIKAGEFQYSDGWDVLKIIREAEDPQVAADLIADVLMRNIGGLSDGFWDDANKNLLKLALLAVAIGQNYTRISESTGELSNDRTLAEVYALITSKDMEVTIANLIRTSAYNQRYLENPYNTWVKHQQKDSIKAGLATKLGIFNNISLSRILSEDEIDFKALNDQKTIIYVICSDSDRTYQCILALFTTMMFKRMTEIADGKPEKRLDIPLYIFFEEFKNIGYIPDLSVKIATLRSRRINMVFCYQNIAQLMDTYSIERGGKMEWETITANCSVQLCCGIHPSDTRTAEYFSDQSRDMTIIERTENRSMHRFAKGLNTDTHMRATERPTSRKVLLPSDVANITKDEILICNQNYNVVIENKYFYKYHPMYQYQAAGRSGHVEFTENGEPVKRTHFLHVPEWRKREMEKRERLVTGSDTVIRDEMFRVVKLRDFHKQVWEKMNPEIESPKSWLERITDRLYESDEGSAVKRECHSVHSYDYFLSATEPQDDTGPGTFVMDEMDPFAQERMKKPIEKKDMPSENDGIFDGELF